MAKNYKAGDGFIPCPSCPKKQQPKCRKEGKCLAGVK